MIFVIIISVITFLFKNVTIKITILCMNKNGSNGGNLFFYLSYTNLFKCFNGLEMRMVQFIYLIFQYGTDLLNMFRRGKKKKK